ncbi:MAG: SDR family oxidoreductase [Anaerolineales bacterium]
MNQITTHAVTGAYSYTGKYITGRLLAQGQRVITLTNNPKRINPHATEVPAFPYNFDHPEKLAETLCGVDTLYNTYWVRFDHGDKSFTQAVANTKTLFQAAKTAGVRRVVHVSITNPSIDSPLPYFRGKAQLESDLTESGLSYAILRPTVIFGREDILINNIAYLLRRFPVFAVPGDGSYQLQPIYVEDMADLAVQAGKIEEDIIWDAVGPEIYRFDEMVIQIGAAVGAHTRLVRVPPQIALTLSRLVGIFVKDVVLTGHEVDGLMAGLLVSNLPPRGRESLEEWLCENKEIVGARYASELARHYNARNRSAGL